MITNENDDHRGDTWYAITFGLLLVVAATIRYRMLGTTLFEDEVWVANLVRHGGWHPHSYNTPMLFYWIERGWTAIRGVSDSALREPAALFGVVLCAIPLFAPVLRTTRFVWAVLLAFSSPLIFYSERLKQYTLEACVVATLLVLFLRLRNSRHWLTTASFFLLASLAVLTLHSPIFVLAAMAAVSIRSPRMLAGFAGVFALFVVAYVGWMKPGPETVRLHGDMTEFFRLSGRWITSPRLFAINTQHWVGQALNLTRFWWLFVPLLIGAWWVRERDFVLPLLAILPPLEAALASVLHIYPYGEVRLMIFAFPALFLLIATALAAGARRVPALLLLLVPVVLSGTVRDVYNDTYMNVHDLRPLYTMITASHVPGEPIYADPSYAAPLSYYYPQAARDLRWVAAGSDALPGWYIQRASSFHAQSRNPIFSLGEAVASHTP